MAVGLGPHGEPVRLSGVTGEYVRLSALLQPPQRPEPWQDALSGMVADLVRRFDPGGYQLQCPLSGCGWHLLVPRMELDPLEHLDGDSYTTRATGVPREDVELVLRTHVDLHAVLTETDVRDAPLPSECDCDGPRSGLGHARWCRACPS